MSQFRQLAAIMFTDIVGYTALMGNDDRRAFAILNENRELQKPIIEQFHGRWIKELGDGVMASFNTVADAVYAAIKIQEECNATKDFKLRIGIHQGDVVLEHDDIFGDAVNIAARIQAAASPGCIFISESVHHNVANKKEIETRFVKEEILKNVSQPVRMYQVLFEGSEIIIADKPKIVAIENSIAVLPFINMSNDPEQEYFSDGISEDIINDLAQVSGLKVIGRTSSFVFKGKHLDLKIIGEQLKVSYILEGSVRKSGNKLRITAQLIKVSDGYHLYAQKFDREMEDVFAIQDEISMAILNAVKIKLLGAEKEGVLKKYTENVEAYQLYLNGRFHMNKYTPDGIFKAIEYFDAAISIDSTYAIAFAEKSFCYSNIASFGWQTGEEIKSQAFEAAQQAIRLDDGIAESHLAIGRIKLHWDWKVREAKMSFEKALAFNPNKAEVHVQLGFCAVLLGQDKEAFAYAGKAESLDPFSLLNLTFTGVIYVGGSNAEKLILLGKRLTDLEPNFYGGHMWTGAGYGLQKRYEEAIKEFEIAVTLNPDFLTLSFLGLYYGGMGEKTKALEIIEKMKKMEAAETAGNCFIGNVHGAIGEWDTAFQYFDKAVENRESQILWSILFFRDLQVDMKDPRVLRLFEKMGQPYL